MNVNITPKACQFAEDAGLYVEARIDTVVRPNGAESERKVIEIGEEDSDFLIQYGVSDTGALYLIVKPAYLEDLPAHITTSLQLRSVVEFAGAQL